MRLLIVILHLICVLESWCKHMTINILLLTLNIPRRMGLRAILVLGLSLLILNIFRRRWLRVTLVLALLCCVLLVKKLLLLV
jgi:hypothetical protein